MKRFSLKTLIAIVTIACFVLFANFVNLPHTIDLAAQPTDVEIGNPISLIHRTKGTTSPVFYVKNASVTEIEHSESGCAVSFRTSLVAKFNLWIQGEENLLALPGVHE